jgi:hypothetical protein
MTFTSGHFEIRKWPKNYKKLVKDLHRNIHTKFHSNPLSGHLLILCVFTSVLCGINKEVKENNNNKKPNPILAFYIQTRGAQTTI